MGKDSPSPPPAPDYAGAAQVTAAGNKDAAIAAQRGSMINQYTPYGNLTYSEAGQDSRGNPYYNANIDLSQSGQQMLDQQNKLGTGLFNAQDQALNQVNSQGPMDLNSVQSVADKAYGNYTSRLDPQWQAATTSEENKLVNQGLRPGMEAYDNDMRDFNNSKNDAYTQANTAAINTMPQTYQLAASQYSQPLNQLNALRTGSQVTNPSFVSTPQQQTVAGPNMLGAAQAQGQYDQGVYNSQVGQQNAAMGGLMGLAGAGLGGWASSNAGGAALTRLFSDRRLKSNIKRVGTHDLGIGIYEYEIFGKRQRGVMADEVEQVMPDAVSTHESGYKMVDYGKINVFRHHH